MEPPIDLPFQNIVEALINFDTPLHHRIAQRLSDLDPIELDQLGQVWNQISTERRKSLMEMVESLSTHNYLLDFTSFCRFSLRDVDPNVRLIAVRTLWDYEQNDIIQIFIELLNSDDNADVRAAAASGLGRYVYSGEVDDLSRSKLRLIEDCLLEALEKEDADQVRRAALESLGYSSRKEIPKYIIESFQSNDKNWKASALVAMGRSANQDYQSAIMSMLESNLPLLRAHAARAAGELEIKEAAPLLIDLLEDPSDEVRSASIWSLSEIGGENIHKIFEELFAEAEDKEEQELLEAAIENLTFTEGSKLMPMLGLPEDIDEPDSDEWIEAFIEGDEDLDDEEYLDEYDDEEDA